MAFTPEEIKIINSNGTATPDKVYASTDSIWYIGTKTGRLDIEKPLLGNVTGTTLRTIVSQIGIYSTEELEELLEVIIGRLDGLDKAIKEVECKALTYSIAL